MTVPRSPDDTDDIGRTPVEPGDDHAVDDIPTIYCSRCDRTWELTYELEELYAGNQAFEQFALDHKRHSGHFPDDVTPWLVTCQACPDGEEFLDERPARRWAETHARHARHRVQLQHAPSDVDVVVQPTGEKTPTASAESKSE